MALDHERGKTKQKEIQDNLTEFLLSNDIDKSSSIEISEFILKSAIRVIPPKKEEYMMKMITTLPSGRGGARSNKLGNIKLHIGQLVKSLASSTFVVGSAIQMPILIPMAFILLWSSLRNISEVNLTENDAAIIWAMWVYCDKKKNIIPSENLLTIVNGHLEKYSRTSINQQDLNHSLKKLEKIGSIKRSKNNPLNWWLCESVAIKFY